LKEIYGMNAILRITDIQVDDSTSHPIVRVLLENPGDKPVASGYLVAKRVSINGSTEHTTLPCTIPLAPGDKIRLSLMLEGALKGVDFTGYQSSEGEVETRVTGLLSWWRSPWSLKAA
jgi:hypothetical protein